MESILFSKLLKINSVLSMSRIVKTIQQLVGDSERITFIVLDHDQLVGIADIARSKNEDPVLGNLFVLESERRTFIGNRLIREALRWAIEHETSLWLNVKPGDWLTKWYSRCGFKETDDRTSNGNIWMKWNVVKSDKK